MKALVYEKAHTLDTWAIELTDVAEPTPGESDVLVEVRAVGINPGETFLRKTRSADAGGRVLLGWEFAGEVVGVGAAVRRFKVGDRVFGTGDMRRDGAWAERVAADHRIVAAIPDPLSFTPPPACRSGQSRPGKRCSVTLARCRSTSTASSSSVARAGSARSLSSS